MTINFDDRTNTVTFLEADYITDILWPNFSGTVGDFNQPKGINPSGQPVGKRSFKVRINDEGAANALTSKGYNVRYNEPKREGDLPYYSLEVFLEYKNPRFAPVVFTRTLGSDGENYKNESTVDDLDNLDISTLSFTIRPYEWEYLGKSGVKAELSRLCAYVNDLPF